MFDSKKWNYGFLFSGFFLLSLWAAPGPAHASDDFHLWTWESVLVDLDDLLSIDDFDLWWKFKNENRTYEDIQDRWRITNDLGVKFPLFDDPDIGFSIGCEYIKDYATKEDKEFDEIRPRIQLDYNVDLLWGWDLYIRGRVEMRDLHPSGKQQYRFRPMMKFSRPNLFKISDIPVKFYTYVEPYINLETGDMDLLWFRSGLEFKLNSFTCYTIGCQVQINNCLADEQTDSMLWTGIDFKF